MDIVMITILAAIAIIMGIFGVICSIKNYKIGFVISMIFFFAIAIVLAGIGVKIIIPYLIAVG